MKAGPALALISLALFAATSSPAQTSPQPMHPATAAPSPSSGQEAAQGRTWNYALTLDGDIIPNATSYAAPTVSADRDWLHLEARYNSENLRTGSLWLGYNFSRGKTLVLNVTPILGGVFGRSTGIAPGCEASLTYKKFQLSVSNEYVFDTSHHSGSFYYSWPQATYSPLDWLHVGLVAQRTKAFHTSLGTQRGFFLGVSHKRFHFTTNVFNAGFTSPSYVLEVGYSH